MEQYISFSAITVAIACKMTPNLLDYKGISCAQPFSGCPTDFQLDSGPDFGWAIQKHWSSFGEAMLLLIWKHALGCCPVER